MFLALDAQNAEPVSSQIAAAWGDLRGNGMAGSQLPGV
jgi:hypothetical protein